MLTTEQLEKIVFDLFTDPNCVEAIAFTLFRLDDSITNVLEYYNKFNLRDKYAKWDSSGISVNICPPHASYKSTGLLGGIITEYDTEDLEIDLLTRDNYQVSVSTFIDENDDIQVGLSVDELVGEKQKSNWSYIIFTTEGFDPTSAIYFSAVALLNEDALNTAPLVLSDGHISLIRYKLTKELAKIKEFVTA